MKLYEINEKILECVDAETGEILDFEKLDELQIEKETKIENIALWIKDLDAEAKALKAEKQAFEERQKAAEKKVESLKQYLSYILEGTNFKTTKAIVNFRKTQKVDVPDVYKLDENYLKYSEPTPDKMAIKRAIQSGQEVAGASLIESISISIK